MRVALDVSDLTSERLDGTTVYARELLPRLALDLAEMGHDVTAYAPREPRVPFPREENIHVAIIPGKRFWTQTKLSRALFRSVPDVLFLPIQTVPLYRPRTLKVIATVHDLDFLDSPETYTVGNRFLLRWFTRVVARNATHLIAISHTTKQAILQRYRRLPDDITVVYHGYDQQRFRPPSSDAERRTVSRRMQELYRIPSSTILFVGALQPRKNISGLVAAFERLQKQGQAADLVIVGGQGWKEQDVLQRIERSPSHAAIHVLRGVPADHLLGLYWNASVFVLPSFSEGFGLPLLEAMACGTPVVTSNTCALAEIAGDAALTVDPKDHVGIAHAIATMVGEQPVRALYVERGLRRAAQFSWGKTSHDTASVIAAVLKRQ